MNTLKIKLKIFFCACLCVLFFLFVCGSIYLKHGEKKIVVGAKNCTEQHILGEMLALLIEKHTDLHVVRRFNLEGTTVCFNALRSGNIDAYFEYTGTAILDILKESIPQGDLFQYIKETFAKKYQLIWLDRLGFENQYGLIIKSDKKIDSISKILKWKNFRLAFDPEFASRLERKYLINTYPKLKNIPFKLMDQVMLYRSLLSGSIDVISGCSTDGRLEDERFIFLEDDCQCLPSYEIAPMVRKKCLEQFPQIRSIFTLINDKISAQEMRLLNYQVEFGKKDIKQVARKFLHDKGLIT